MNGHTALTRQADRSNENIEALFRGEPSGSGNQECIARHTKLVADSVFAELLPWRGIHAVLYHRDAIRGRSAFGQDAPNELGNSDDAIIQDTATEEGPCATPEPVRKVARHHDRRNEGETGSGRRDYVVKVMVNVDDIELRSHRPDEDRQLPPLGVVPHLQLHCRYARGFGPPSDLRNCTTTDHHVVTALEQTGCEVHNVLFRPRPIRHSARDFENPHANPPLVSYCARFTDPATSRCGSGRRQSTTRGRCRARPPARCSPNRSA